ncbi:MAG: hypothetical protein EHM84_05245, partial [Lysobacterales bacterium]
MAAIFGIIGAVSAHELDEMGRRLEHRGGVPTWSEVAQGVYLGQVATALQAPSIEGKFSLVVDAPEGLVPGSTQRIVEALLHSSAAEDLDERLSFPFALAAWDDADQELILARDFLGLKPLHICALASGGVAFATEYKALLAIHQVTARADPDAVRCLQMYKAMPSGRTLLADVVPVPPGSVLRLRRDGSIAREERMPDIRLVVDPM